MMKAKATFRGRLMAAVVILLGAAAVAGALSPAASGEVRPFLQAMGIISCSGSNPCQEGKNAGKGAGLEGISAKGSGVVGQTTNTAESTGLAGVVGQDKSTGGFSNAGVEGTSIKGIGVFGSSSSNDGVQGNSTSGVGVRGVSSSSEGVFGSSQASVGVFGSSQDSYGAIGSSANYIGVYANGGSVANGFLTPALSVNGSANNPDLMYACSFGNQVPCIVYPGSPTPQLAVVNNGNIFITGQIFTSGSCGNGCAATPSAGEKRVRLFTPQESLPTVEDSGQAQLVGGRTYVRIDPAFANTMDSHAAYMVFITPLGDSNGLYVANEAAGGFEVHENKGGRSTLMFSYRIVAKPFGRHAARLHMITVSKPGTSLSLTSRLE